MHSETSNIRRQVTRHRANRGIIDSAPRSARDCGGEIQGIDLGSMLVLSKQADTPAGKRACEDSMPSGRLRKQIVMAALTAFLTMTFCALPGMAAAAGSGGDILWSLNYSRPGLQEAVSSTLDQQGNIIVTGFTDENQGDYLTVKFDTTGQNIAWAKAFDKNGNSDQPTAVTVSPSDDVIVTGYVFTQTGYDIHTVAYCGDTRLPECANGGDILWQHTYAAPYGGDDFATAITTDIAGNVYVAGFTQGANGDDFLLIKYGPNGPDAGGSPLWVRSLDSAAHSHDRITAVTVKAGVVAVVGDSYNGSNFDILAAIWSADGTPGKTMRYDGGEGNDFSRRIAIDNNGNVIFAGTRLLNSNTDFYFASFDPTTGIENWHQSVDSGNADDLRDMVIDSGGDVYVTGTTFNGSTDVFVGRYAAADGHIIWEAVSYSSGIDDTDIPARMVIDESGDLFISGYRQKGLTGDDDFMVLKYNRLNGQFLWDGFFNGPANRDDQAIGIGLDSNGKLFVSGWSDRTLPLGGASRTASSGTTTTVTVNSAGWSADHWQNSEVVFTSGAISGYSRKITANTGDTLTFTPALPQPVSAGATFRIAANTAGGGSSDTAAVPSTSTLIDTGQSWTADQWAGYVLYVINGANAGTFRNVTSNTATAITVSPAFSTPPTAGDLYYLMPATDDYDYFALEMAPGLINPPDTLAATAASETEIKLVWNQNSDNEEGFEIFRKAGELTPWPATPTASTGMDVTTFTDSGLTPDTRYFYQVRAYNTTLGIISHFSNTASALTTVLSYQSPALKYIFNSTFNNDDYATAIAVGPDNNPLVTGYSYEDLGMSFDYFTVKIDRLSGLEQWHARYDDPDGEVDIATCVTVNDNNESFVSGYASLAGANGNTNDICTVKYAAAGPPAFGSPHEWQTQYNGPGASDDRSVAVEAATDNSGNIYVSGYGRNAAGDDDIYLLKYDPAGNLLWPVGDPEIPAPYDGGGNDYPAAMAIDQNGDVIIVGETFVTGSDYDILIRKYRGTDGGEIWTRKIDFASGWDVGNDVAVGNNGDIYIVGEVTNANGDTDGYLMRLATATGQNAWTAPILLQGPAGGNDAFKKIDIDVNDNQMVAAGTRLSSAGNDDFVVQRYTAAGQPVWNRLLDRPLNDDFLQAMAMDASGNVCVAGKTDSGGLSDVIAVKYAYNGDILGSTSFDRGQSDEISHAAAADSGEVWLAGYSVNSSGNADYLVMVCNGDDLMAPSPFTATANYIHVDLAWHENVPDADGYNLRKQPGSCATADPGAWITMPSQPYGTHVYTDNNLAPNDTFCYQIQTYRGTETSRRIEIEATTFNPPAPANFTAVTLSSSQVQLRWSDNIVNEEGFRLQRCDNGVCAQDSDFTVTFPDLPAGTTGFEDNTACEGKNYTYRLIGFSSQWAAYDYAYAATTTTGKVAPTILSATPVSEGEIDLAWSDGNSDEDAFLIYSCIDPGSGCTPDTANPIKIEAPEGSVIDLKMNEATWTPGSADARDSSGHGHNGMVRGTSTPGKFDGADDYLDLGIIPEVVAAATFSAEIRFKRAADHQETVTSNGTHNVLIAQSSSIESDNLEIGTSGNDIEVFIRDENSYNFLTFPAGITDGKWYHLLLTYDASAANELKIYLNGTPVGQSDLCQGKLAISNVAPWTVGLARPDGTANNLWGDFEGSIDQLTLYNRTLSATEASRYYSDGNLPLSTAIAPLIPATTYRFWVTAKKDTPGHCGGFWETDEVLSDAVASMTATTPDIGSGSGQEPVLNNATVDSVDPSTNINLGWSDRSGTEEKFIVERCDGDCSGGFTPDPAFTVSLAAGTTAYTDNSACSATYTYRVLAGRDNAPAWTSGPSNMLTATTATPQAPTLLVDPPVMLNESEIKLTWTDNSGDESGFDVQRCSGSGCAFVDYPTDQTITLTAPPHAATGTTTFVDNTALPDHIYRYRIRARKDTGCSWTTAWTNVAAIDTSIANIGTLSLSGTAANTTQIDLAWNDLTSHEGNYLVERCDQADCSSWQTDQSIPLPPDTAFYSDTGTAICSGSSHSYRVKAINNGLSQGNGGCFTKRMKINAVTPFIPGAVTEITIAYDPSMRSDFADLRLYQFNDLSEVTGNEIPYWIAGKQDSVSATIWFITPDNIDNLYLYYGNGVAGNVSDGNRVVTFFDDFPGKAINSGKWAENDSIYADKIRQQDDLLLRYAGRYEWTDVIGRTLFDRGQNDLTLYLQASYSNPTIGSFDFGWFIDSTGSKTTTSMVHAMENGGNHIQIIREQSHTSYARNASNQYTYFTYNTPYEFKIIARKAGGAQYFIRGGEGTSYSYPNWHLIFDTSGTYTPLTSTSPLRPAIMSYSQDADIHSIAAFAGDLNEATVTLATAEDTGCAPMPQTWAITSNTLAVTTPTTAVPVITNAVDSSESEADINWDNQVSDYSGTVIRRCKHTGTVDCTNDADFINRADIPGIIDTAGAAPLVKLRLESTAWPQATASVIDSSGNSINGIPHGNVIPDGNGEINRGARFNGVDSYIEIPGTGAMENVTDSSFTFSAWVKAEKAPPGTDTVNHTDDTYGIISRPGYHTALRYNQNMHFDFNVWDAGNVPIGVSGSNVYPPGTWHYITGVVDDSAKEVRLYVDGNLEASNSYGTALRDYGTAPYYIGVGIPTGTAYTWFFDGMIDEAAVFNKALSQDEVLAAMGGKGYYHDRGMERGTTYTYRIHNYKNASCQWQTPDSVPADVTTPQPPPPSAFNANTVDSTTIILDWQNQAGGTVGYNLERSMSPDLGASWNSYQTFPIIDVATTSYTDPDLYADTAYKYRIRAFGGLSNDGGGTWQAKQPLTISNFVPDFQVKMTVSYDPLMQADFSDIRFYDENTGLELPHWIESKTDGVSAEVWFKTGATNTVILVFGNPAATTDSDPARVFELYDDFTAASLDTTVWDATGTTVSGGEAVITAPDAGGWRYLRSKKSFSGEMNVDIVMSTSGNKGGQGSHFSGFIKAGQALPAASATAMDYGMPHIGYGEGWCGDWYTCYEQATGSSRSGARIYLNSNGNDTFDLNFIRKNGSSDFNVTNLSSSATFSRNGYAANVPPLTTAMNIFLGADDVNAAYGPVTLNIDKVWVRKYAATPPTATQGATTTTSLSAWQSIWTDATPTPVVTPLPPAPVLTTVTGVSESAIDLAWTWNYTYNDQSAFDIERCEGTATNCVTLQAGPDVTSYADHNLTNNASYCYRVRAKKDGITHPWNGEWSGQLCAATNAINAPDGLAAIPNPSDTNRIDLGWQDGFESEDGYRIFRCAGDPSVCIQDSDFSQITPTAGANQINYGDTEACSGNAYSYKIKAYSDGLPLSLSNSGGGEWSTRAKLAITAFVTDNQTRVTIPWQPGMRDDFGDIRFFDEKAGVELPYWLESKTDGVSAVFWFKSGSANNIDIYFGNPAATYGGDPNQVFIAFAANLASGSLATDLKNADGFIIEANVSTTNSSYGPKINLDITGNGQEKTSIFQSNRLYRRGYDSAGNIINNISGTFNYYPLNSFHNWQIRVRDQTLSYLFDRQNYIPGSTNNPILPTTTPLPYSHGTVSFASYYGSYCAYREIFVRKFVADEPVVSVGPDESANAPAWESAFSTTATAIANSPTAPVLTDPITVNDETRVSLDWTDDNPDEAWFIISRADWNGSTCGSFSDVGQTAGADILTYSDSGLSANTTYCYRVRAQRAIAGACPAWDSPESNVVMVTTTVTGPDNLNATARDTTMIDLAWSNHTTSETGFTVKRCSGDTSTCTDPSQANFDRSFTPAATSDVFSDPEVCPGSTHTYAVEANGSGWDSAFSNLAAATTGTTTAPSSLVLAEVYNQDNDSRRIDMAWTDNNPDRSRTLAQRCDLETSGDCSAGSGNFQTIAVIPGLDTFDTTINPLTWGSWYQFGAATATASAPPLDVSDSSGYIRTYWDNGRAVLESSAVNLGETLWNQNRLVLTHPEILGNGDFDLSFDYNLPLATGTETATSLQVPIRVQVDLGGVDQAVLSHEINSSGHSYWWRITSNGVNHDGGLATTDTSGGFRVKRTGTTIELYIKQADGSWGTPVASQTDGYSGTTPLRVLLLQYTRRDQTTVNKAGIDNFKLLTTNPLQFHDQDANLPLLPSHTYYYRVKTEKKSTTCAAWDNLYSNISHELTNPAMPVLTATAPGARQIDLHWTDAATDENGYSLERLLINGKYIEIFRSAPGITDYTDTRDIDPGATYTYRVRSYRDDSGVMSYSAYSPATITTPTTGGNTTCVINP